MTHEEMANIWNSLKKKLKAYCDENGFSDVILGYPGARSAIVSVLAADALGAERVHALMMKTDYTSELSLQIAAKIAALNGFAYKVVDIQPVIDNQNAFWQACLAKNRKISSWKIFKRGKRQNADGLF